MTHEWVLDVLADLQSFADANELSALAAHLEQAGLIAAAEIVALANGMPQQTYADAPAVRDHPSATGLLNRA